MPASPVSQWLDHGFPAAKPRFLGCQPLLSAWFLPLGAKNARSGRKTRRERGTGPKGRLCVWTLGSDRNPSSRRGSCLSARKMPDPGGKHAESAGSRRDGDLVCGASDPRAPRHPSDPSGSDPARHPSTRGCTRADEWVDATKGENRRSCSRTVGVSRTQWRRPRQSRVDLGPRRRRRSFQTEPVAVRYEPDVRKPRR